MNQTLSKKQRNLKKVCEYKNIFIFLKFILLKLVQTTTYQMETDFQKRLLTIKN
jgi:hypothetical protein